MAVIDTFLNKLQRLINVADSIKTNKAINRNASLEIENVLYANGITGEVSYDDLLTLKKNDVRTIFKAMYSEKFESEYNRFMSKRAIIDEFRNISISHVGAFEPKEYSGAMDYISDFANKLNEFLSSNKANDVSIGNDLYKKYLNMFRGNKLVVPVTDFDEFDSLLDSMKFSDKESGDIKMFVGLGNIELLLPDDKDELTVLNKYEIILKNKYSKYKDTIVLLKGESFSLDTFDESLDRIKGRLNVNYDDVRQAMCCVLLGKKISEYKDVSAKKDMPANIKEEYLSSLEEELDKITIKSREQSSKKEETKDEVKPEISRDPVLDEVENIISSEKALIDSVNFDDLNMYLFEGIKEQSEETIGYRIVSVITALYSEMEKLNNFTDTPSVYNACLNNIKEYVDAYHKLKEEQKGYLVKKQSIKK